MDFRSLRVLPLAATLALLLTACPAEEPDVAVEQPEDEIDETVDEPEDDVDQPDVADPEIESVTLRAVTAWPETQLSHTNPFMYFIERVEELSDGAIQVDIIGGPETMDVMEIHENVATGTIDLALTTTGYYTDVIPEAMVFEYTTLSPQEWRERGLFDIVNEWHIDRLNQIVLARGGWGQRYALYTTQPVETLEDFQGMRFRGAPLYLGLLEELGAEMVSMPPGDIYTALERGTVDGTAWTDIGVTQMSLEEVLNHVILPPYYNSGIVFNINLDTWEGLSDAARDVITEAAVSAEERSPDFMEEVRDEEFAIFNEAGVEIIELEGQVANDYLARAQTGLFGEFDRRGIDPSTAEELHEQFTDEPLPE